MSTSRILPSSFLFIALLLAGCASSGSGTLPEDTASIDNVQDLVMHLGRQGYVLRPVQLTSPFSLADVGYEYQVEGERIRIYEFESAEAAGHAVEEFLLDTSGGGQSTIFRHRSLLLAYAGNSPSLHLTVANASGPAVY